MDQHHKNKSHGTEHKAEISYNALTKDEMSLWHREVETIADQYQGRKGVEVGHTDILLHACPLAGRK